MKVEMKSDGCLVITPETGVEAFALKNWNRGEGLLVIAALCQAADGKGEKG